MAQALLERVAALEQDAAARRDYAEARRLSATRAQLESAAAEVARLQNAEQDAVAARDYQRAGQEAELRQDAEAKLQSVTAEVENDLDLLDMTAEAPETMPIDAPLAAAQPAATSGTATAPPVATPVWQQAKPFQPRPSTAEVPPVPDSNTLQAPLLQPVGVPANGQGVRSDSAVINIPPSHVVASGLERVFCPILVLSILLLPGGFPGCIAAAEYMCGSNMTRISGWLACQMILSRVLAALCMIAGTGTLWIKECDYDGECEYFSYWGYSIAMYISALCYLLLYCLCAGALGAMPRGV